MDQLGVTQQAIAEWLRQKAVTVRAPAPGSGHDDLLPIKPLLKGVKIVGLGESTHGTREFFRCKHWMIEFLVKEMGFTVFAMEASFAAGHAINRWLLHGTGNVPTALSGLKYIAWDTHEFLELLGWLRQHNESVPDEQKVRFYGLDYTYNDDGRKEVKDYLRDVDQGWAARIEPVFRILAELESKWPIHIDHEAREAARQVVSELRELIAFLNTTRDHLDDPVSRARLDHLIRFCAVILESAALDDNTRSRHMGENLLSLVAGEIGDRKVIYWGHNYHVGVETFPDKPPTFGHVLRERYGDAYLALALEYGDGRYLARSLGPDGLADLQVVSIPPPPEGTLSWFLVGADISDFIVMLREPVDEPEVQTWLRTPILAHAMGWVATHPESEYEPASVRLRYDGIIFTRESTPVNPTDAARHNAARGLWL